MTVHEHSGPLAIIAIFGTVAVLALIIAGVLAITSADPATVITFAGICTTVAGYLAPSPLSKLHGVSPSADRVTPPQ